MKEFYVQANNNSQQNIFSTVRDAINSLPPAGELCVIKIAPGVYREKLRLSRPGTILEGLGSDPSETLLTYDDFAFDQMPDGSRRGTFRSYSFLLEADDVTLRNLTISNSSGDEKKAGQAIALYADGDRLLIDRCRLLGRQDTLFTGPLPPKEIQPGGFIGPRQFAPRINGHHLYRDCYICGNIDFIFGSATAYFEHCTIESLMHDNREKIQGYVTAPSTPENQSFGYVFRQCRFVSGECAPDSVYLGRPWRDYGQSVFLDCTFGSHIRQEGFHDWGKALARQESCFSTVNCIRENGEPYLATAPFARQLSDSRLQTLTRERVLGDWLL